MRASEAIKGTWTNSLSIFEAKFLSTDYSYVDYIVLFGAWSFDHMIVKVLAKYVIHEYILCMSDRAMII